MEGLFQDLVSGIDEKAEKACAGLRIFGNRAIERLIELLKNDNADIRWWAIRALVEFDQSLIITISILKALEDRSRDVRQAAAMAFYIHPNSLALKSLIKALSDEDRMTAKIASNALIKLGKEATSSLLQELKTGTSSSRIEAARALAAIKDPQSIKQMINSLEDGSALENYWINLGLENMGVGIVYFPPE